MTAKKWTERGKKFSNSSLKLEDQVVEWLSSQFRYKCKKHEPVIAKEGSLKKEYEVDVHGIYKNFLGKFKKHLWVIISLLYKEIEELSQKVANLSISHVIISISYKP